MKRFHPLDDSNELSASFSTVAYNFEVICLLILIAKSFLFQGPGSSFLNGTNGCYMVVFQYGSIVLFNVLEHEVDGYLKIVRKHASGLLPEMRKDGEFFCLI